jgi:hypothetical protein
MDSVHDQDELQERLIEAPGRLQSCPSTHHLSLLRITFGPWRVFLGGAVDETAVPCASARGRAAGIVKLS